MFRPRYLLPLLIALGILFGCIFGLPRFDPQYSAERTVDNLLDAFEDNDMDALAEYLAADYQDSSKLSREEILDFARALRHVMRSCTIRRPQTSITLNEEKTSAVIVRQLTLRTSGFGPTQQMLQDFNGGTSPATFTLRRNSGQAWDWHIVSIETPYTHRVPGYKKRVEKLARQLDEFAP